MNDLQVVKNPESNPQSLIQLAIESKLPIEHLERLMTLKDRYDANESKKEFFTSMNKFQSNCPQLQKTKLVDMGSKKYKYAPLGEITEAIKEIMSQTGLSFRWELEEQPEKISCSCIVSHSSGHSEKTTMSAARDISGNKNDIQSRGSTITYLQRYTLISAFGISTADEDVDGNLPPITNGKHVTPQQPAQPVNKADQPSTNPNHNIDQKSSQKLWLNKFVDNKGTEITTEWTKAVACLNAGTHTIDQIKKKYMISKILTGELEKEYKKPIQANA